MKKLVCLALLLLVAAAVALAAGSDDLRCATCGRTIKKTRHYLEFDGKPYCSQACFEAALPKCATCGKVVGDGRKAGEYLTHKGKIYCSQACFEEALPKCASCGKPVNGGIKVDNKYYCNADCHRQSLPRCAICGTPVDGGLRDPLDRDKAYCSQECYATTLPQCSICGKRMQSWRTLDEKRYCDSCAALPRCFNCGHPGAEAVLPDGRRQCRSCFAAALFDTAQARALFERVRKEIGDSLGLATDRAIAFHLVDQHQLARATKAKKASERGFYFYRASVHDSAGRRRTVGETADIYILNGLRPAEFMDVAAHELAHDIQQKLYPRIKSKVTKEGFAEYVAGLMATAWGREELNRERLKNEFKEYAAGYQRMAKIGQNGGLKTVLDYLKQQNRKGG